MKVRFKLFKISVFWCLIMPVLSYAQQKELITLEDIWVKYKFYPTNIDGFNFMKGDQVYTKAEAGKIEAFDIKNDKKLDLIFDAAEHKAIVFSEYVFSQDEQLILLTNEATPVYRHSSEGRFSIYNRKTKALQPLSTNEGKQRDAWFSPTSDKIAFSRKNNLFYIDFKTGKEHVITTDGLENKVINGTPDWVYEEEFSFHRAFEWSADGRYLAYIRFDEADVPSFTMEQYANKLYPGSTTFKYPKAGEKNSKVTLWVYDTQTAKTEQVKLKEGDLYIPRLFWVERGNQLMVFQLNRHQNQLDLLSYSPQSKQLTTVLTETSKYYVDIEHKFWKFLSKSDEFLWTSEQDGFMHLYLYNLKGQKVRQITQGRFDIEKVHGYDEASNLIYYEAAEQKPYETGVYVVDIQGKNKRALADKSGDNSGDFSPGLKYYVHKFSDKTTPPNYKICDTQKANCRTLQANEALQKTIGNIQFSAPEFITIPTDSATLNAWMIKPLNFDPNKKYPVLMYCYGGPGSQTVKNSFDPFNGMWYQMLAQKGYIVVSVDGRGTGNRGEYFKKCTYMQLGKYETIDQIAAAQWLAKQPYVEASRLGIWGWSFGGYLSTLSLLKGNDVFKMAMAVAPVTNWKWYDTVYTERFLRTPDENKQGYEDNSPVNFANRLKGKYLIVHGMADDNVHYQNAVEMVNALIRANKPFDMQFYPNANHSIGGHRRIHLFNKLTEFVLQNL